MKTRTLPFLAGLTGGGIVAAVVLIIGVGTSTKTTTVVQQAPLAATPTSDGKSAFTPREIYKRAAPGVGLVRAQIVQRVQSPFDLGPTVQRGEATGSGFVIDKHGDMLTNAHVISGASKVTVQFADHKTVDAKVIGKDTSSDIALIKVDPSGVDLHPLLLGSAKEVQVGDLTIAIGNPFGLDRTLTTGVVSALQRQIQAPNGFSIDNVIQTDAAINPGNSGGPLLDAAGRVIGINSQIETGGSGNGNVGIGFAVPIDTARKELGQLQSGGSVARAYIGLTTITIDGSLSRLNLPVKSGALVQDVQQGSPAEKAGLRGGNITAQTSSGTIALGGDIITAIDGKPVNTSDDLGNVIAKHKPNDTVSVKVLRDGKSKTVKVTLAKRPESLDQQLAQGQQGGVLPGG
ncbi:MAG TPA: trypsin-like peptidase domain-containing protein [Solirubrobacteraceae bacterium]